MLALSVLTGRKIVWPNLVISLVEIYKLVSFKSGYGTSLFALRTALTTDCVTNNLPSPAPYSRVKLLELQLNTKKVLLYYSNDIRTIYRALLSKAQRFETTQKMYQLFICITL